MLRSEIEAAGELTAEALATGGQLIRELHQGVASRPFGVLGAAAAPVKTIHDGVSGAAYRGVASGLRSLARTTARAAATAAPQSGAPPLSERPRPALILGALAGFYGDRLHSWENPLAPRMTLRLGGRELPPDPQRLADAYPAASDRLAVFVHGLCETEAAWWLPARGCAPDERRPYGERLREDIGYTPLYVRYNSGRHVSDNGRDLAELLQRTVEAWPLPVREIALVGHSMGGLVARSACHQAPKSEFAAAVRHVFCLGTPHLGADLEKGANALAWALHRLPETRPLARVLNSRSVGIKDLRFGSCAEEDWRDRDADELLRDHCGEVPFLPHATYYFVSSTLRPAALGRVLGDLLVRSPSATGRGSGRGRRIPFEVDHGQELLGPTHFDLLCHPEVYRQLRRWLETHAAAPAAA